MDSLNKHITEKISHDTSTGERIYKYFFKGKECKSHEIDGPLVKKMIGYNLILEDLRDTKTWLEQAYHLVPKDIFPQTSVDYYRLGHLGDEANHKIIKSLFFSSIVFYGKCFTQAKGRGVKLEKKIIPKEYEDKHDEIMEYRHCIAAHSGEGKWDSGHVALILPPQNKTELGFTKKTNLYRLDFEDDRMDEYKFLDLVNILIDTVDNKFHTIGQQINEKIVLPKGQEFWYEK